MGQWDECSETSMDSLDNTKEIFASFSSDQKAEFVDRLYALEKPFPLVKIEKMASLYGMFDIKNPEVLTPWLRTALRGRCQEAVASALQLVTLQGRMKFTRPIYRELYRWEG